MDDKLANVAPEGLEHVKPSDIVLPRVKLVQPVSQGDVGKPGEFVNDVTQEAFGERRIHFVRYYPGRMMWGEEADVPLCVSRDGDLPDPSIAEPPSETCGDCKCSQWIDNKKPECSQTYGFSLIDLDTMMPCAIQLSRSSSYAARRVLTYAFLNQVPLKKLSCKMSSKEMKQGRGVYYVVDFSEFKVEQCDRADQIATMGEL